MFFMYDQVQSLNIDWQRDIHRRLTGGRARFKHGGDVDDENPST
jgi:hypothetical protein